MIHRLLNTNAVIALVSRRRSEALLHRVESTETGSLTVSSVVDHEFHCGLAQVLRRWLRPSTFLSSR